MKEKSQRGLYDPQFEHDACGIGFIANLKNKKSHDNVRKALDMLERMEHRGACGCEENTGDGAGILIQKPHKFFLRVSKDSGFSLPEYDDYGVGQMFFPANNKSVETEVKKLLETTLQKFGINIIGYRTVPGNNEPIGPSSQAVEPLIQQVLIALYNKSFYTKR